MVYGHNLSDPTQVTERDLDHGNSVTLTYEGDDKPTHFFVHDKVVHFYVNNGCWDGEYDHSTRTKTFWSPSGDNIIKDVRVFNEKREPITNLEDLDWKEEVIKATSYDNVLDDDLPF